MDAAEQAPPVAILNVAKWVLCATLIEASIPRGGGTSMRAAAIIGALLGFAGAAHAAPLTLLCTGELTMDGKQVTVDRETAILDLDARTFKPPMYPAFPLIRVTESDVSFGNDNASLSSWGSLDRVSGSLSMNVMRPDERKKLHAGNSARFLAFMSAKCAPAKRMF